MMLSRYSRLSLSVCLVLFFSPPIHAQDFPLDEYETHVKRYLSSLENLAVDFTRTDYALDGSLTLRDEFSLISIPGHFRVKVIERTTYKDGRERLKTQWILLRPDGYFEITEKAEGQFLLKEIRKEITSPLLVDAMTALNTLLMPICSYQHPTNRLIRGDLKPTLSAEVMDFHRHSGEAGPAVTFRTRDGHGTESEFELNDRWLVTGLRIKTTPPEFGLKREITYIQIGERLLPSRITLERSEVSGQPKTPPYVAEFRNYKVYHGSMPEFGLAQFGIPDPSSAYQPVSSRWYLWFIGIAVVSLAIGGFFWYRVQRRKKMTPVADSAKGK